MDTPKILSPVNSFESAVQVIAAGADEIYCAAQIPGAEHTLNRPAACCVPTYEELGQIARYARSRGVDTIVTLELPFLSEFMAGQMRDHISSYTDQGIDAWIVGDLGLVTLVKDMELGIPIYASTYFVALNRETVDFLRKLGIQRVVLERHMTVQEIRQVVERSRDVEVEVFVHGSGCSNINVNCYLGGRPSNRSLLQEESREVKGMFTPCRTPFDIYEIGKGEQRIARAPILDAYTFCALCKVPALLETGVVGLKIVGRCMPVEYQAQTTEMYRKLVDLMTQERSGRSRRARRRRIMKMLEPVKDAIFQPIMPRFQDSPSPPSIRETLCGDERCYFSSLFHVPYRHPRRDLRRSGAR
jgi:putative protease